MNTKVTDGLKFQRNYPTDKECCFHPNTDLHISFLFQCYIWAHMGNEHQQNYISLAQDYYLLYHS